MLKRFIFFILLFSSSIVSAGFFPTTADIPLMDEIILTENEYFSFDTPAGQILTREGILQTPPSSVRSFYDKTLQSLGWEKQEQDLYRRGKDTLQIIFPEENRIRFDILLSN